MVTKSTSMDQPQGTKTPAPIQQSKSAGNLGPYDGHGKRGRNLIARIKGLSESSSSSEDDEEDEDELTNARINTSRVRKTNSNTKPRKEEKVYDYCAECGQVHTADEETTEETDHDICPDCGVPHNPFQHPPSPSSKNKWRQYVEHCRNAMIQLANQSYHQVPQDPPEPKREEILPSIEGPHTTDELRGGARYKMKYLGTTQVLSQHPVTKETRMEQAREAFARIKVPDGEVQPATDVDIVISLERIKVLNCEGKHEDVMMDHALRTVCFICDMGDILVLMSRRLTTDLPDLSLDKQGSVSLSKLLAEREQRTSKNICHIFQCEEAQTISKAIGQAFNMAYRQFLKSNGISHDNVEEAEYCHVLESQKIVGQDLDLLADSSNTRDIVIQKKRGEALGIMLLESGWGSMLPTVFVAHIAIYSPSARLGGSLSVGDHILACNGASLVGLPLSECNQILRNTRSSARVILKIVSCPPVVDVVVSRPDVKYQLGFSVQNGTICSLLRGGIAERGGVRVGHRIIEINGESVVAKSHQHIVDILATTSGDISMKTLPVAMYRLMVGIDTPTHV
ncbi:amyloid-beta A4 precursor protein-binding family A member 2-like [Rhopilema esculentum]|uniref:amyloid-beta A4 precursor protein-binding family A member 2-like n=1 Tax=Rhopilema esculentum TaxID=499914 RepID=UPI0031E11A4E